VYSPPTVLSLFCDMREGRAREVEREGACQSGFRAAGRPFQGHTSPATNSLVLAKPKHDIFLVMDLDALSDEVIVFFLLAPLFGR
jgi:hypothetical protein